MYTSWCPSVKKVSYSVYANESRTVIQEHCLVNCNFFVDVTDWYGDCDSGDGGERRQRDDSERRDRDRDRERRHRDEKDGKNRDGDRERRHHRDEPEKARSSKHSSEVPQLPKEVVPFSCRVL